MTAFVSLSAASFVTSMITAAFGIGGGLGLLAVMPAVVPISAVVPLHGVTQLVSNGSRFLAGHREAETRLLPAYFVGACLGAGVGYFFIGRVPDHYLGAVLGGFILLCTWTDLVKKLGRFVTSFFTIAFIQTFLSLFVASVGLISQPVLIKQGLAKDRVIVTHAMQMSVLHGLKVFAFVAAGFPFLQHWKALLVLIASSAAGSLAGTLCRHKVPDRFGAMALNAGITIFALKMIVDAVR